MSAVTTTAPRTSTTGSLVLTGLVATAAASVATPVVAAAGHAVGISLEIGRAPIPVLGFGTLMLTHLVAAAIVVPAVARRLS